MQPFAKQLYFSPDANDFIYLGYPMHLTPTELRILSYLVEKEGGAADASALLERCYAGKEPDASNVSVRICTINQKARAIGGRKLIRFVHGRGYKFCDDV